MSSAAVAASADGVVGAWETSGQVYYAAFDAARPGITSPVPAPGPGGSRKHPAIARNGRGETLLVWTDGTGWQKGGALAWQVFDKSGRPTGEKGRVEGGIPVWGLAAVVARPDGGFTIIH
jgi:hypothetical protein